MLPTAWQVATAGTLGFVLGWIAAFVDVGQDPTAAPGANRDRRAGDSLQKPKAAQKEIPGPTQPVVDNPLDKDAKSNEPEMLPAEIRRLIDLHNQERAKAELPLLEPEPRLRAAALRHARDMAENDLMQHKGSDGSTFVDRVQNEGYPIARGGENIAWGMRTPELAMKVWKNSESHYRNILGAFSQIGAAAWRSREGQTYWCVVFGTPLNPGSGTGKPADQPRRDPEPRPNADPPR